MSLVAQTSLFYTNFIVSLFVKTVILINSGFFLLKKFCPETQ